MGEDMNELSELELSPNDSSGVDADAMGLVYFLRMCVLAGAAFAWLRRVVLRVVQGMAIIGGRLLEG